MGHACIEIALLIKMGHGSVYSFFVHKMGHGPHAQANHLAMDSEWHQQVRSQGGGQVGQQVERQGRNMESCNPRTQGGCTL